MASTIPTSASVSESTVIAASLADVWHLIKLPDFYHFWSKLQKAEEEKGMAERTEIVKWSFKDGTVLDVKMEEHSSIDHFITYSVIASNPPLSYSSQISTIRLWPVTSGPSEGSTFVTWSAHFSSDADAGVIEDARYKRKEALADLAAAVVKK